MRRRLMMLTGALAGLAVLLSGCGTNTYGVARKSARELKSVSDADLCYSQRYWRSPQLMNEIRLRNLDCGGIATGRTAAGSAAGRRIVGTIPSAEGGPGCSHYLRSAAARGDYRNALLLHWGILASDRPKMSLLGKTVTVSPLTPFPEILLRRNKKKGAKFSERYQFDGISVRIDNTVTFVCPPNTEGECEVTRFHGVLTASAGGRSESIETKGECGL
jgi:hypothetical protein